MILPELSTTVCNWGNFRFKYSYHSHILTRDLRIAREKNEESFLKKMKILRTKANRFSSGKGKHY